MRAIARLRDGIDDAPGAHGQQSAQNGCDAASDLPSDHLELVVEDVHADDPADPRLEGGRPNDEPAAEGFADSRHVGQAVVVEHGGHRPLPFGDHRQAALLQRPALTRPLERDHPVTRVHHRGEHRQEFLDIAVEPAEDDDGAPGFRLGVQIKGRQCRTARTAPRQG